MSDTENAEATADDGFTADQTFEGGDAGVMVDMTSVEEASFEALPVGVYNTTIVECEYKLSASSNQPMWALQHVVSEGEYENRRLFDNISFSPKALPMSKKTIGRLAPELLAGPFNPEVEGPKLQGRQCKVRVKVEPHYQEKDRKVNKISEYLPLGGADSFMNG